MLKSLKFFDLPKVEERVLEFWRRNKIFEKSLEQTRGQKRFGFYEGPPTANGQPGIHHVLARVFKDLIPRYKTMRGFFVSRRAGWDTHGLPVEIEVEKKLGLKSKQDIERYGVAKFNEATRQSVWQYKDDWEKLTERIGFWLDFKNAYITYDNGYIEQLWGIIKEIDERRLLYKSHKVVPWCPRCGTALSSHELALGYQKTADQSVFIKFPLQSRAVEWRKTAILSWTTTLWTLPGNVALAINPRHRFVKVADPDQKGHWLVLEKSSAVRLGLDGGKNLPAEKLLGQSYQPPFRIKSLINKKAFKIYPADFVAADEGTGVVHTAVMYGEDDYQLGKEIGLPQHHTVDEQGRFTKEVPGLAGLDVKSKEAEEKILNHLAANGLTLKTESYFHDYPFCWRCETAVIYYARHSWFIAMSRLRDKLLAANAGINWIPEHLKNGRFGEWLKEVKDWAISRERYWGTPLPIWEHAKSAGAKARTGKCSAYLVIGSLGELERCGGKAPKDLHRPYIDEVVLQCPQCQGELRRVKEVMDVWFDSGAAPFASGEYPGNYPADYICEAVDQTRGWFYTLLAVAVLLDKGAPYKNVISLGHILDKDGRKMSKSRGNVVDPWEVVKRNGADAVRWYFYTINQPGEPKSFAEAELVKTSRKFLNLFYNSYVFYQTYQTGGAGLVENHLLDEWIIARLQQTIKETTDYLDDYDITWGAKAIEFLVDDLSRWYIRRSRKRPAALPILGKILVELSKLAAPFIPFFAEAVYQSLKKPKSAESVHLCRWPVADEKLINKDLLNQMATVRRLANSALAQRAEKGIKVRQPLAKLKIRDEKLKAAGELLKILADEVNVEKIVFDSKIKKEIELDLKITPALRKAGQLRELVRLIQDLRQEAGLQPKDKITLFLEAPADLRKVVSVSKDFKLTVGAGRLAFKRAGKFAVEVSAKIGGEAVWIGLMRVSSK